MSIQHHQEQADVALSIIKVYLNHYGVTPEEQQAFINTLNTHAKHKVHLAFAKQAEAIQQLQEEEEQC